MNNNKIFTEIGIKEPYFPVINNCSSIFCFVQKQFRILQFKIRSEIQ